MITGNIAGTGSDTALIAAIAPASPRNSSLGSVLNDVLAQLPALGTLTILLAAGTVSVGATGTSGGTITDNITFEPTGIVRSLTDWLSSMTVTSGLTGFTAGSVTPSTPGSSALGAMVRDALDAEEKAYSIGSFVDAIDRAFQASATPPVEITIDISQANETVDVVAYSVAPTSFTGTVVATFTRTAATSPTAQWGE